MCPFGCGMTKRPAWFSAAKGHHHAGSGPLVEVRRDFAGGETVSGEDTRIDFATGYANGLEPA